MGLENLKSVFQEELNNSIKEFSSNVITNVDGTNFFNTPPQPTIHIATNPTDFSTAVGNNDLPFTPVNQLGDRFMDGLSYEKLYNPNHTPKDNPSHKGIVPINYPNVSRDKLNIRDQDNSLFGGSFRTSAISAIGALLGKAGLTGNFQEFLQDTGKEPYIVSSIGKGGRRINSNFVQGGIPISRGLTDGARILKYLTSPAGVAFILKQNFLGENTKSVYITPEGSLFSSSQRFKDTYNPVSTLLQTVGRAGFGPIGLVDKTEIGFASTFGTDEYGSKLLSLPGFGTIQTSTTVKYDLNRTFNEGGQTGGFSFSDFGNRLLNTIKGELGAPVEIKKESSGGDKMTLAKIVRGDGTNSLDYTTTIFGQTVDIPAPALFAVGVDVESQNEGMPFYFKDMRDNNYVFFRAYIEGLTESISPSYNSTQYIGRSEPVYTYNQSEREVTMTLKLFAQTKDELKAIYAKMNKLTSLCYPEYLEDTFTLEKTQGTGEDMIVVSETASYGNRMKPPLTKLRIGEMYGKQNDELMGYIKSLSYTVEQSSPFETERGKRVPKFIIANIGYQVIHSTVPNLETKFYGYIGEN